ncbi:hypothetical protein L1049_007226 [Liquidambar formosana]|uniref:DUF4283 domain-containing protein n=1 Tax=Liquidambar formosana TaxID=63359 RepID=A0AAP0RH32_LIQFO
MATSPNTNCPWGLSSTRHHWGFHAPPIFGSDTSATAVRPSFAAVVGKVNKPLPPLDLSLHSVPVPIVKGNVISVTLDEDVYRESLDECRSNLIGRVLLPKGSKPIRLEDLQNKLSSLWNPQGHWLVVPFGKGYFDLHFSSVEERQRIWAFGSCNLDPGILRLSPWILDFNPEDQRNSHVQIWVRIYRLSQEYWHYKHLTAIARGIGTSLKIDDATRLRKFGYYARVLVDIDLSNPLPNTLWVERKDYGFNVELFYENLPYFCACCKSIGHLASNCRIARNGAGAQKFYEDRPLSQGRSQSRKPHGEKIWVRTDKSNAAARSLADKTNDITTLVTSNGGDTSSTPHPSSEDKTGNGDHHTDAPTVLDKSLEVEAVTCSSPLARLHKEAKLSIKINGTPFGYFSCSRGVRQGDPLSLILFCLAEEVLCRGLDKLVFDKKVHPISSPRGGIGYWDSKYFDIDIIGHALEFRSSLLRRRLGGS